MSLLRNPIVVATLFVACFIGLMAALSERNKAEEIKGKCAALGGTPIVKNGVTLCVKAVVYELLV